MQWATSEELGSKVAKVRVERQKQDHFDNEMSHCRGWESQIEHWENDGNRPSVQRLQYSSPEYVSQFRQLGSEHSWLEARAKKTMNTVHILIINSD